MKPFAFLFIAFLFLLNAGKLNAQTVTKYYDSNWVNVSKESAFYYADITKEADVYHVASYWLHSGKLYGTSTYADTNFAKGIGIRKVYFENGVLHDSIVNDGKGNIATIDEFSESGKLITHAFYDAKAQEMKGETYDENGNKKPGFITYQRQAMFPGGQPAWFEYLQTHLKADVPARKKAPVGLYSVMVSFLVDQNGKISDVKAENDPGYGTATEAVRVIQKGPDWIPAVQNNKKVIYRQRQPITFQVEEAAK